MNDRLVLSAFCDLVGKTKIGQSANRGQRHSNSRIVFDAWIASCVSQILHLMLRRHDLR
jgi:hypothetical protein